MNNELDPLGLGHTDLEESGGGEIWCLRADAKITGSTIINLP